MFLVAAAFFWKGTLITTPLVTALNAGYSELHLPWQMTLDIGTGAVKASPVFGPGPNTFSKEYLLYKPASINQGQFWSVELANGSGFVPTLAVSLGSLGLVVLCLLYIYFIKAGASLCKGLKNQNRDFSAYVLLSSFFSAAFLWYIALVYVPSSPNLFLGAVFTGVFLGSAAKAGRGGSIKAIAFDWRAGSIVVMRTAGIFALLILVAGFAFYAAKAAAFGYFTAGAKALSASTPDIALASQDFKRALALDPADVYDQAVVQADLAAIGAFASQLSAAGSNAKPTDAQVQAVGSLINDAASYAAAAVKRDPSNYYNYLAQAQVFSAAASLSVNGAYASAVTAYTNAIRYNPYDPALYVSLAQLAFGQKKYDDATGYIGSALQLKNNYTDAVYTPLADPGGAGPDGERHHLGQIRHTARPERPDSLFPAWPSPVQCRRIFRCCDFLCQSSLALSELRQRPVLPRPVIFKDRRLDRCHSPIPGSGQNESGQCGHRLDPGEPRSRQNAVRQRGSSGLHA